MSHEWQLRYFFVLKLLKDEDYKDGILFWIKKVFETSTMWFWNLIKPNFR